MENDTVCKFEPDKDWCDYTSKTIGQRKHTLQQEAFPDRGTLCKDEGYIYEEGITALNLCVLNVLTLKCRKHKLIGLQK